MNKLAFINFCLTFGGNLQLKYKKINFSENLSNVWELFEQLVACPKGKRKVIWGYQQGRRCQQKIPSQEGWGIWIFAGTTHKFLYFHILTYNINARNRDKKNVEACKRKSMGLKRVYAPDVIYSLL